MSEPTTGIIEVTIRIRFNQDITKDVARKFVNEMEYNIIPGDGSNVSIADTEVIEDDIDLLFGN